MVAKVLFWLPLNAVEYLTWHVLVSSDYKWFYSINLYVLLRIQSQYNFKKIHSGWQNENYQFHFHYPRPQPNGKDKYNLDSHISEYITLRMYVCQKRRTPGEDECNFDGAHVVCRLYSKLLAIRKRGHMLMMMMMINMDRGANWSKWQIPGWFSEPWSAGWWWPCLPAPGLSAAVR